MATKLPFNQIQVGGAVLIDPSEFIYGSGRYTQNGEDSAVTTADAYIHNHRAAVTRDAACEVFGDFRTSDTGYPVAGTGAPWPVGADAIQLDLIATSGVTGIAMGTMSGIISVEWDEETNKSTIAIKGIA
jgi:hypothetical protein